MTNTFKWFFLGDLQMPFHDKRAVDLTMQVMKWWKPQAIDIVGDISDQIEYSTYSDGTTDEFFNRLKKEEDNSPLNFIWKNEEVVRQFYHDVRAQHKKADMHLSIGNHDCFSMEGHRVVTKNGYKSWDELSIGDRVLSVDDNGESIWEPIEAIHLYPNDKSMLWKLNGQNVRGEFTDNHRMMVKYKSGGEIKEKTALEFSRTWGGVFTVAARNKQPDAPVPDENIRLLAWCLTDSSLSGNKWVFHQSEPKHERIIKLLEALDIPFRDTFRQRDTKEICGKILKSIPKVSHDIFVPRESVMWDYEAHWRLPEIAWRFSERQVRLLMDELQYTDGTQATLGRNCWVIYCSDDTKRDELRLLMTMNGIASTETEYAPGYWRINAVPRTESKFEIGNSDDRLERVQANGVYCITVPNGRFFVEAFGATHLTGNCRIFKYIDKKSPDHKDAVTPEFLWDLDKLGITYSHYHEPPKHRFAGIHTHHGTTTTSTGLAVRSDIETYNISLVRGHDHRGGVVYKTYPMTNSALVGMGTGHLCDPNGYGLQYTNNPSWELGFGIAHVENDRAHLQFIPISKEYTCVVDGKLFQG